MVNLTEKQSLIFEKFIRTIFKTLKLIDLKKENTMCLRHIN